MRLTCPACGCHGDMELFVSLDDYKRAMGVLMELPGQLAPLGLRYLRLFRPKGKTLTGSKSVRVVTELRDLVAKETIQWEGGRVLPNRPEYWVAGITIMLDRAEAGKLERLPMANNNYLRSVAYGQAEKAFEAGHRAKEVEAAQRQSVSQPRAAQPAQADSQTMDPAQSAEQCKKVLESLKKRKKS